MVQTLKNLGNPSEFWEYFEKITKIPRCSGKEELIRNYIMKEAEQLGFKTVVDKIGNLFVKIPAVTKTNKPAIILQCHLDMVCEKNQEVKHDFSKDPLELRIIEYNKNKWLTAKGTTLGADNGVGICYLLTLMKKSHLGELKFGALELLFTVNEEQGLSGVFKIGKDLIDGEYLVNLDSEEDNAITIGCAGGIVTRANIKIKYDNVNESKNKGIPVKLSIKGLMGGHSGVDIHKDRANAIKVLSKILWTVNNKFSIEINSIIGGNRSNAIPREAQSIFYVNKDQLVEIKNFINEIISEIMLKISEIEPNVKILLEEIKNFADTRILPEKVKNKLLHLLYAIPNGPISMHQKIPNLVHTSSNLASIKTSDDFINIITSQRSFHEVSKKDIYERIEVLFKLADKNWRIEHIGDYPGWDPDFNSKLLKIAKKKYAEIFNKDVLVKAVHAGLETGILKKKFPEIEMISIGPTVAGAHSPDEKLKIKSVEKIWNFLIKLLGAL